ncbi:MAG: Oar protein [Lysobacteraceae bacterium]|nr:MAG: Oar protein [Xanthomonadaceae bacterium]
MTNRNRVRLSQLSLGLAIALAAAPAFAQNTTSAVGGRIVGSDSQPVAGAQVTIVHAPSGTVSNATTGVDGRYSARGLRVGGPYTITIVKDGVSETREGVYLQLAETTAVDATLGEDTTTLAAVEVTGTAVLSEVFSAESMGATTSINREQIDAYASINRNLQDYARLDPRLSQTDKERGEISLGGQNSRFNSITIDGVNTSDTFGLEANNLPTAKQPISIDTIESVQVNVSNYDVTQTGYTGANINAVTKSGTNEFKGSVSYVYRDDNFAGDRLNTTTGDFFDSPAFEETTMGFTFGGPLIKDRLFFFAAYEEFSSSRNAPEFGPIGSQFTNVNITQPQIDRAIALAQSRYGMDVGTPAFPEGNELTVNDALIKLDWNITDSQRFSLRYNKTEQSEPIYYGFGIRNLSLSSHWTTQEKLFESVVGQLFSDWTENFSTELKVARRDYDSVFNNNSRLPSIAIQFNNPAAPGLPTGISTLLFGTERSRQFNQLNTETTSAYLAGNLFVGDHELKFGFDYDDNSIFNAFLQDTNGNYTFSCLETITCVNSFESGRPFTYASQQPRAGLSLVDGAAQWSNQNVGLFVQDTWSVNYNLTLMGGLRLDTPNIDESPRYNAAANAAAIAGVGPFGRQTGGFGFDNSVTIDGKDLLQPRFGFNYTFDSERPTQLRGGFGLFQGAAANVWLSNPYSNTGLATQIFACGGSSPACTAPIFSANPDGQPQPIGTQPAANVDLIDPNLEQPAIWKANLAFEHELPFWGLVASAELLLTKTETGIYYEHLNLGEATRIGPDGRELYWDANGLNPARWNANGSGTSVRSRARSNLAFGNVLIAKPSDKGTGEMLTLALSKPMVNDWSWTLAYTYADATDVSPLTSSTSNSQWNGRMIFNPNEEVEATSNYLVKDRFTGALQWRKFFFGGYKTEIGMFYEGRKGKPYSWTYINDFNGDGISGNDLMYIPNPGQVTFRDNNGNGTADEAAAFWAIINANPELRGNVGGVVARNNSYNPWINSFDVRISQDLPGFFEGNKTVISLDILNIGNLINKDWGQIDEIGFPSNRSFVNYAGVDPVTGNYVYNVGNVERAVNRQRSGESSWAAQFTIRYEF